MFGTSKVIAATILLGATTFAQEPEQDTTADTTMDEDVAVDSIGDATEESGAAEAPRDLPPEPETSSEVRSAAKESVGSVSTSSGQDSAPEIENEEEANFADVEPERRGASLIPEIHAFVSQGYIKSSHNNYLARSEQGSFEFSEVGLNFTKQISDQLRVGMQLFMRDLGPIGNYKPQFDWFYLDYSFFDWLGFRAGRTKIPFGLYNDINDIDAARVPILLPQSVYPTENRDALLAQTGLELYGRIPLGAAGHLGYRAYGGTIFLDTSDSTTVDNFNAPYLAGGRVMWETPLEGLRTGATLQTLSLDGDFVLTPETLQGLQDAGVLPAGASNLIPFRIPAVLWVGSLEYVFHDFLFAAEYSRWHLRLRSDYPDILPPTDTTNERFYVMASYSVARWFTPGAYYSVLFPDAQQRTGREAQWHDLALTLRFDMTDNWLFKLEGHHMRGTAGLNPALNAGIPLTELNPNWGVLLAKTTAYF